MEGESSGNFPRVSVNIYGKAPLDVISVRRGINKVNGNPKQKRKTDLNDRPPVASQLLYCKSP